MSVFGLILVCIFPYSVRMWENVDQNNSEYGHFLRSAFVDKAINIENFTTKSSYIEGLLEVTIDSNSSFSKHVTYLCATANRKWHVMSWNHSLFPNSVIALWSGWHIVGAPTIKLIIFTKELCTSFTKTSRSLLKGY